MKPIQLTIPQPCHQNWNQMLPQQQGKFCQSCQKTVVDFTVMSDREVLNYFNNKTVDTCGRFNEDQLNRTLQVPLQKNIGKWRFLLQLLLPAVFAMQKVRAQMPGYKSAPTVFKSIAGTMPIQNAISTEVRSKTRIIIGGASSVNANSTDIVIKATLVDENDGAIAGATVCVKGVRSGVSTDTTGNFSIRLKTGQSIVVSAVGYQPKSFTQEEFLTDKGLKISIENEALQMTGIKIQLTRSDLSIMGDVIVVRSRIHKQNSHQNETLKRNYRVIADSSKVFINIFKKKFIASNDTGLKILQNPIAAGQNFKASFTVPKKDRYLLEIIDASGKLIQAQTINIQSIQQTETIDGSRLHQAGVYIIHLTNGEKKNVFNGKLVVQ